MFEDTNGIIRSLYSKDNTIKQAMQWSKGQTIQWPKEEDKEYNYRKTLLRKISNENPTEKRG